MEYMRIMHDYSCNICLKLSIHSADPINVSYWCIILKVISNLDMSKVHAAVYPDYDL